MQPNPENIRRAAGLMQSWRSLNRGFDIPPAAARPLVLALLELPSWTLVERCVEDLLEDLKDLPAPVEVHAWRRGNAPRPRSCSRCDGTGNVAVRTVETPRQGPHLVYERCECTRRGGYPQEAA